MPFKFNPLTGQLDLVNGAGAGSGNVTGIPPTDIRAITRWADTSGTTIENSPNTLVQDSGAIEAQAFIAMRNVTNGTITVNGGETWIAPSIEMGPGGVVILAANSQLIIL